MNRCEEVLKHSTNKGLKIEKDELYHSDTYLGSEYDEGLKHWKYIKKYKNSRGKTVYVYANKEMHSNIQDTRAKAKSAYADAKAENRAHGLYEDSAFSTGKKYGQDDLHAQWANTYTMLGDSYREDYDKMLVRNTPNKVIKRDVYKTIREIKKKSKKGLDFINGYFKYLSNH